MTGRRRLVLFAALVSAAVFASACGDDGGGGSGGTLSIVLGADGLTGLPAELDAGIYEVTVQNDTAADVDLDIVDNGGLPADEFLSDLQSVIEGGPFPDYLDAASGLGAVAAGQTRTTTIALGPAPYAVVDTAAEVPAVLGEIVVGGDAPDVADLPSGATITATDYAFAVEGITSATSTVTFVNNGPDQVHHVVVMPYEDGVDAAAAEAAIPTMFDLPEDEAPPEDLPLPVEGGEFGSGVFSAGVGGTFDGAFEAGRTYALFCFISDIAGGPPHAIAHDMYEVFTVDA